VINRVARTNDQPQLVIDREIQNLCRPLNDKEYSLLEKDIRARGCLDPIKCWRDRKGRYIILDGHHRYKICKDLGRSYTTEPLEFETKEEAIKWVIENHLARRNLSPMEAAYLRGTRYNTEKKAPGKSSDSTLHQNDGKIGETAVRLAPTMGVSPATMERDGILATAIDKLREVVGDDLGMKIRGGNVKLPRKNIIEFSEMPDGEMKAMAEHLEQGKKFAEAERLVHPAAETAPMDKKIHRVEDHLCKIQKILSKMETTAEPFKLEELLETIQQIRERIIEIGGSSSDHSSDDHENGPNSGLQEDNQIVPDTDEGAEPEEHPEEGGLIIPEQDEDDEPEEWHDKPYEDEDREGEVDDYDADLLDDDTSEEEDPTALPPGWNFYEDAMEKLEVAS